MAKPGEINTQKAIDLIASAIGELPCLPSTRGTGRVMALYAIGAANRTTGQIDAIKIGLTREKGTLAGRLKTLQTASPDRLYLLAAIEEVHERLELLIHQILAKDHIRGEWFRPSPTLDTVVGSIKIIAEGLPV